MNRPKIYIAGPEVFLRDAVLAGEKLKAICAKYGLEGLFPLDAQFKGDFIPSPGTALKIYSANMNLLKECDAVIANMEPFRGPSMDVGTAFEVGVAEGLGKPVFGYSKSDYSYKEKVEEYFGPHSIRFEGTTHWAPDDTSVDDFELVDNPMLLGCIDNLLYSNFEEAVKAAVDFFKIFRD